MARAQAMGFDTSQTYYHGTPHIFEAFSLEYGRDGEKAIFTTRDAAIADQYGAGEDGHNVIPLLAKIERPHVVDAQGATYENSNMIDWIKAAKDRDADALIVKNLSDAGGLQDQYAFLKPENLRAKYGAAFGRAG